MMHWRNGSPVYPSLQKHMGVWLTTRHSAFAPQEPTQGSLHFWLMQASWLEHSGLLAHSGRQFGGDPMNSGRQEHEGASLKTWHWALGPHGDGWQGFVGIGSISVAVHAEDNCEMSKEFWILHRVDSRRSPTYGSGCTARMDFRCFVRDNCILDCGWRLGSGLGFRRFLCKDHRTFDSCTLDSVDSRNWQCTRDDKLVDFQGSQGHKNMRLSHCCHDIGCWVHRAMASKVRRRMVLMK